MKLSNIMLGILAVITVVGTIGSAIMLVFAFSFCEWGRVFFYFLLFVVCAELSAVSVLKIIKRYKNK